MAPPGDSLLTTFQKHIEDMRGLTLCKICLRPFYEPFTLACGHTYCYSCLRDWLHGPPDQGADKACPDCRQKIETEPSPNYTLRDLVHMFVNRVELLPEDETVQEHERGKCAEAKVLADDRKAGGVFRGKFKRTRLSLIGFDRALRDAADGSADDYSGDEDEHDSELDDFIDDEAEDDDDYPTEIDHDDGLGDHTAAYDAFHRVVGHHHTDTGLVRIVETDTSQGEDGSEAEMAAQATDYDDDTDATPRRPRMRSFAGTCVGGSMSVDEPQASTSTPAAHSAAHLLGRLQARRAHNSHGFSRYVAQPAATRSPQPSRRTAPQSANWATARFHRRRENGAGAGAGAARPHPYTRVR
ncbi:hypothetical protein DV737_g4570, partial [Chaetothyriales sp. CBS 132003]